MELVDGLVTPPIDRGETLAYTVRGSLEPAADRDFAAFALLLDDRFRSAIWSHLLSCFVVEVENEALYASLLDQPQVYVEVLPELR